MALPENKSVQAANTTGAHSYNIILPNGYKIWRIRSFYQRKVRNYGTAQFTEYS